MKPKQSRNTRRPLTREELLALPVSTDLPMLGRALGISEPTVRELHRRGEFEAMGIRVVRLGAKWRVITADVLQVLGVTPSIRPDRESFDGEPTASRGD